MTTTQVMVTYLIDAQTAHRTGELDDDAVPATCVKSCAVQEHYSWQGVRLCTRAIIAGPLMHSQTHTVLPSLDVVQTYWPFKRVYFHSIAEFLQRGLVSASTFLGCFRKSDISALPISSSRLSFVEVPTSSRVRSFARFPNSCR